MQWRRLAFLAVAVGVVTGLTVSPALAGNSPNRKADTANITADDKTYGLGAERLNARIIAAKKKALVATGAPIVIGHRVTVGGNYPFQDTADAVAAMQEYYNNVLGGVGADYKKGKPGRPIKIELCTSELAAAAAQSCANELVAKDPLTIFDTLNLTQSLEFPIYNQAQIPVVEGTALTPTQLSNPQIPTIDGGCFTSAVVPIVHTMGTKKYKKVALINAGNLSSSQACLKAYENIKNQFPKSELMVFPYTSTDADQLAVAQQVVAAQPDAVIVQSSGPNCSQFWTAWDQLGYEGEVYNATSCSSPALFKSSPDLVVGQNFSFPAENPEAPNSYFKDHPFSKVELEMTDKALEAYKPGGVFTANARTNGGKFMWLAGVLDQMALNGTEINRANLLQAIAAESYHQPNAAAPVCGLQVPNFTSLCSFKNSIWKVKSVDSDGGATWKLVVKDLDTADNFRKLAGAAPATTTTTAAA